MANDDFVEGLVPQQDDFVEGLLPPEKDDFVEDRERHPSKTDALKDILQRYADAKKNESKSANVMQYASGMAKPAALLEALFGGKLGEEYSAQKAELAKKQPQSLPESMTRSLTDPIEAALKTVPALYEKNVHEKMSDYEQLTPEQKIRVGVPGALMSPLNKVGDFGVLAAELPVIGKIASSTLSGAAQGMAYNAAMSDPSKESDYAQSAAIGSLVGGVPAVAGGAIKGLVDIEKGNIGKLLQKPREWAENSLFKKTGEKKMTQAFIPKENIRPTGSKLTEELRQKMSNFGGSLNGTDLSPDMSLGEVWQDPQMKEQFLKSVQKVMSSRKRDAYSIPIRDIEDSIAKKISSNEETLSGNIDEFLSGKLLMTPKQRAEYFRINSDWPDANITDPRFPEIQEKLSGILKDVESGKLNQNLEDVAQHGQGSRTANIAGMRINVTPEMKSAASPQISLDASNRIAAREALTNILRGKEAWSKIPVLKSAINTMDAVGDFGRGMERLYTPSKVAQQVVKDPSQLLRLSESDRSIGTIAKSVLKDLNQGNTKAATAKSYLFATNPEFRRMFVGQSAEQSQSR